MPLWFLRQITEQIGAKLPKTGFHSMKMSRFLHKKRDKNIYKMPNIKQVWHFIYISLPKSLLSLAEVNVTICQTTEQMRAKSPKIEIID